MLWGWHALEGDNHEVFASVHCVDGNARHGGRSGSYKGQSEAAAIGGRCPYDDRAAVETVKQEMPAATAADATEQEMPAGG